MGLLAAGPPRVEKLKRRGDVSALLDALVHQDGGEDGGARVRADAAAAVAQFDAPGVSEGLVQALADPVAGVRDAAIQSLVARGPSRAVEPLTDAVAMWSGPEHARGRYEALGALEAMHDPAACERVAQSMVERRSELGDSDRDVIARLTRSVPESRAPIVARLMSLLGGSAEGARASELLVWLAPDSVEPLLAALPDESKCEQATRTLGLIHSIEAVEPLCRILVESEAPAARKAAAAALGEIRDVSCVEALLLATSDADYEVRTEASRAFDRFGNVGVAIALTVMMPQPALSSGEQREEQEAAENDDLEDDPGMPLADEPTVEATVVEDPSPEEPTVRDEPASEPTAPAPLPSIEPRRSVPALRRLVRRRARQ